jgi:hypothetical protein
MARVGAYVAKSSADCRAIGGSVETLTTLVKELVTEGDTRVPHGLPSAFSVGYCKQGVFTCFLF